MNGVRRRAMEKRRRRRGDGMRKRYHGLVFCVDSGDGLRGRDGGANGGQKGHRQHRL